MSDAAPEERESLLSQLEDWLETPMIVLSVAWLALVLIELIWGEWRLLEVFGLAIWILFLAEFLLRFWLAPRKMHFLRANVISLIALVVPAFRAFRILRLAGAARGVRLIKLVGTVNRGMRALKSSMSRRGLGYVLLMSLLVLFVGAGGMYAFESPGERGFANFGEALWWTAMLLASFGTDFWPHSAEGRVLCFLLSLYGLGVFGYITASLASFFVGRDATQPDGVAAGADLRALREEIVALRAELSRR